MVDVFSRFRNEPEDLFAPAGGFMTEEAAQILVVDHGECDSFRLFEDGLGGVQVGSQ